MKTAIHAISTRLSGFGLLILAACPWFAPSARAGLTFTVDLYVSGGTYVFYTPMNTNAIAPAALFGIYSVFSPGQPTNGSWRQFSYDTNGFNTINGSEYSYTNLSSALQQITNGTWLIQFTNSTTTNYYKFTVSLPGGLTTNQLPVALMTSPTGDLDNLTNQPTFAWQGQPTNWPVSGSIYVQQFNFNNNNSFYYPATVSTAQTNWTIPVAIPASNPNSYTLVELDYVTNYTGALFVATTPLDTNTSEPISGWTCNSTLESGVQVGFTVAAPPASSTTHTLIAHYTFDNSGDLGQDSSTNGNDIQCESWWGANVQQFTTNAVAGGGAVQFFGQSAMTPCGTAFVNWTNTLMGSFTVSAWIETTNTLGNDGDELSDWDGQSVIYLNNNYNGVIPLGITGTQAAISTGVPAGASGQDTLNSVQSITSGNYVHVVVTRDQGSGLKQIYINGVLDSSDYGEPEVLDGGADWASIGGALGGAYTGLLDDVQIYSGVLGAIDILNLYQNPGSTVPNGAPTTLGTALGATNLTWTMSGDADWFVESTNTYNGSPFAAQSGAISNYQTSTLTATVTGPGTLTFYWSSVDNDPSQNMDYEFAIDDPDTGDIADLYGANGWQSIEDTLGTSGPIVIPPGQHTLIWTVYANNDADPFEAGFLDQVVFMPPDTNPVSANITLNIYREQDPTFGEIYLAFPSFNSVTPAGTGTTTNVVQSPNDSFSSQTDQGGGGSGSLIMYSLGSVLNECTNGLWSLYINYGLQNQRQFQFSASINGLTTNLLSAVKIITPTNGATGFPSTAAIQWLGPSNYSTLNVSKQNIDGSDYVGTTLPVTATSWTPGLVPGTNRCDINYALNNYPNVSFTVPVDSVDSQTVSVWAAQVNLNSTATSILVVSAGPSSVALFNTQNNGTNFQFSFLSQTGFTNGIQYRTNLVSGAWQTYTNVTGDGSLKIISVPLSLFSPSKQGFIRVSTQ